MKYQEKIIHFLKEKSDRLKECNVPVDYIVASDLKYVENLDNDEAEKIWRLLKDESKYQVGLGVLSCPACIGSILKHGYQVCSKCNYGLNHGICTSDNESDYSKIKIYFKENEIDEKIVLSNEFYQNLIKEIENE